MKVNFFVLVPYLSVSVISAEDVSRLVHKCKQIGLLTSLETLYLGMTGNDEALFNPDLPLQLRKGNKFHLITFTNFISTQPSRVTYFSFYINMLQGQNFRVRFKKLLGACGGLWFRARLRKGTNGRLEASIFGWASFGWVSCIIDSFGPHV